MLPNPTQHYEGANIKLSTVRTVRFVNPYSIFSPNPPTPKNFPKCLQVSEIFPIFAP